MPKALPSLIKVIEEESKNIGNYSASHYLFCNAKGTIVTHFNDVCFARFRSEKILKARIFINQHTRHDPEMQKKILDHIEYIVKKSPWRHAFKNVRSPKYYLKNGIAINTNVTTTYAVGAMIALREAWEYNKQHFDSFDKFVGMGLSKEFSLILSNHIRGDGQIYQFKGGHGTFGSVTLKTLINFKNCEIKKQNKSPMKEDAENYYGVFNLFYEQGGTDIINSLLKLPHKVLNRGYWQEKTVLDLDDEKVITQLKEWDNAK